MQLLKVEEAQLSRIIEFLAEGGILIYPTETLYGIGVKFDNRRQLKKIFELKKRPAEKVFPLIVNSNHLDLLVTSIPPIAKKLMEQYWPGPLTLLLPAKTNLPAEITLDNKVAVRMPGASFALDLIKISPFPITATSANISGLPAALDVEEVLKCFQNSSENIIVIDGGKLRGIPSTIMDVTIYPPKIIRQGAVSIDLSSY